MYSPLKISLSIFFPSFLFWTVTDRKLWSSGQLKSFTLRHVVLNLLKILNAGHMTVQEQILVYPWHVGLRFCLIGPQKAVTSLILCLPPSFWAKVAWKRRWRSLFLSWAVQSFVCYTHRLAFSNWSALRREPDSWILRTYSPNWTRTEPAIVKAAERLHDDAPHHCAPEERVAFPACRYSRPFSGLCRVHSILWSLDEVSSLMPSSPTVKSAWRFFFEVAHG